MKSEFFISKCVKTKFLLGKESFFLIFISLIGHKMKLWIITEKYEVG